jgi:hypothetical protein
VLLRTGRLQGNPADRFAGSRDWLIIAAIRETLDAMKHHRPF